jgi:predicted DsbA family dithiol-disulfide isomerase
VRLRNIQHAYGDQVHVQWRTFPLIPDQRPGRRCTPQTLEGRQRAAADEPRALFAPPPLESELPASSLPALTAAKCAERQGEAVFERLHQRLFVAHFHEHLDISRQDVLWRLARESGLDMVRFQQDYTTGEAYQAVLHDYAEGAAWFGVSTLPTVIFNEKVSLVGAVPEEPYRLLLEWLLAGEPGGVIPLGLSASRTGTPGQSAASRPDPRL